MSKKHFNALAEMVRGLRSTHGNNIPADALTDAMARVFSSFNERFDAGRFAKACEPAFEDRVNSKMKQLADAVSNLRLGQKGGE